MNTLNRKEAGRAWRLTKLDVPVKIVGGGGAGPPAPPHAMALSFLVKCTLCWAKYLFSFFFLLFFSLLLKICHFSFSTLNSHGMVPGLVWNPGTFKCSFFFFLGNRPTHHHKRWSNGKWNILLGWPNSKIKKNEWMKVNQLCWKVHVLYEWTSFDFEMSTHWFCNDLDYFVISFPTNVDYIDLLLPPGEKHL